MTSPLNSAPGHGGGTAEEPGGLTPEHTGGLTPRRSPSSWRTMSILARLACRRFWNANVAGMARLWRKQPSKEDPVSPGERRGATPRPRKATLSILLTLWVVLSFLGGSAMQSYGLVERLSKRMTPGSHEIDNLQAEIGSKKGPVWPAAPDDQPLTSAVGFVWLLMSASALLNLLATAGQDLGKVEWDMEWLFTFPVPARTLFLARLAQYVTGNPMLLMFWFYAGPSLTVIYACAGYGLWAVPLALAAMVYYALLITPLGLVVEVAVQKKLAAGRRKNLQAVFVLLGSVLLLLFVAVLISKTLDPVIVGTVHALPAAAWANPFSLPALLCVQGWAPMGAGAAMVVIGALAPISAVRVAEWLVKDGLISSPGVYQGTRTGPAEPCRSQGPGSRLLRSIGNSLRGIVGKELRLLARDRAFFTQALIVPVLMLGFYLLLYWQAGTELIQQPRPAATLAFALGSYVLLFSAFRVLAAEGNALWLLYTFPRPLHVILMHKTLLWSGFAMLYVLAVLVIAGLAGMPLYGEALVAGGFAVVGVVIYAFIAAAIGTLGTNPLETGSRQSVRLDLTYFYLLLVALYANAIYLPLIWTKIVQVVLSVLLAIALWQRVQDHIPYLLEPTGAAPPRLSLTDGLVAAMSFLAVQGIVSIPLAAGTKLPLGTRMLIAFVVAGAVVALAAWFWLRKTPNFLVHTGLAASGTEPRPTLRQVLTPGVLAGLLAGLFAIAYLAVVNAVPALRAWKDSLTLYSPMEDSALFALAVLAAPPFEEFIFRGLIYQGMRRSIRPAFAVLGSAAIFAVVHPPISVIPVFVLGIAAACSFQRSRLLLTPIVTHMVYNLMAVTAGWLM